MTLTSPPLSAATSAVPPSLDALGASSARTAAEAQVGPPARASPGGADERAALGQHESDRLWFIDGKAYDLDEFVRLHPGGQAAISLGRGTNCTELFRSYHFKKAPPSKLFAKYEVDVDRSDPRNLERLADTGFTFDEGGFYKTIQGRARAYFKESGKQIGGTGADQAIAIFLMTAAVGLSVPAYVYGSVAAAVALGVARSLASVNPGHSMSHFSVFPRGRWNSLIFRIGTPFLVSTWSIWSSTHVRSHHVRTLTHDDLQDNYPLKRVQRSMAHRPWHRAQHLYIWFVYLLGLPLWSAQDLVLSGISVFSGVHMGLRFSLRERLVNTATIAFNLLASVAMPFFFLPFWQALLVCFIANAISSMMVILQIAVNHEVPETLGKVATGDRRDWGEHQVLTSHNYGVKSPLALHMSGGLNMQIEHHLFPSIHYTHYPALSRIVQDACVEFGLPYHTSSGIVEATRKHYRLLASNSVPLGYSDEWLGQRGGAAGNERGAAPAPRWGLCPMWCGGGSAP
jgi:linoleoyl-CoA desaturase